MGQLVVVLVTVRAQEDHQAFLEELPTHQEYVLDPASSPLVVVDLNQRPGIQVEVLTPWGPLGVGRQVSAAGLDLQGHQAEVLPKEEADQVDGLTSQEVHQAGEDQMVDECPPWEA